ncbi:MAG: GIY-YIG nuclease family protein [Thermoplasmatota archaeon]
MKGTYLLLIKLPSDVNIQVGKRGLIHFSSGWYVYVGSALRGIERRVARHCSHNKKMHWHIDYLLESVSIVDVFYKEGTRKEECDVASRFLMKCDCIEGFGCSDCACCLSHLFYGSEGHLRSIIEQNEFQRFIH